jgi:hypothetical protein
MKKYSFLQKSFFVSVIILLITNSIVYASELPVSRDVTSCGTWKIESAGSTNDQRIGVTLSRKATGSDCYGIFTLENKTGTLLGGGYSLALNAPTSNANVQYLTYGDAFLVPGLNIEIKTAPIDINQQASVNLQGEVTLGSFLAVDLSFFVMKSIIDLLPVSTGCLISYDQLLLISLRTAPILENTAKLAFSGDLIGSKNELSRVINVFYEKAGDYARDIGIGCFADFLKSIIGKPVVIGKIVLSYITWVPVVIFDYFKYQGMYVSVSLSYIPPIPTPTSTPTPTPTSTPTPTPTSKPIPTPTSTATLKVANYPPGPAHSPLASLQSNTLIETCKWGVYMSLSGFASNSLITVSSSYSEVVCSTGQTVTSSWTQVYSTKTDQNGNLVIAYLHAGTGSYNYTFIDKLGNSASLSFTTSP